MRRNSLIAALILACFVSPVVGQKPPPPGPSPTPSPVPIVPKAVVRSPSGFQVPAGGAVLLDAEESVSDVDQALQWQVVRPPGYFVGTFDKGARGSIAGFFVTAPNLSQTYTIAVSACAFDPGTRRVAVDTAVVDVVAIGSGPPPNPGPEPPPPGPNPAPVVGAAWVTAVFPAELPPEQAPLFLGPKLRQALHAAGVHYRVRLADSPELDAKNLRPFLAGKTLPVLILQGKPGGDGTAAVIAVLPFTTEDEAIRTIGGK